MKKDNNAKNNLADFDAQYLQRPAVHFLGGVDEAGRGCLAGPVVVAVVVADSNFHIEGINDSKQVSATRREKLLPIIEKQAAAIGIGIATAEEIDQINILQATHLAAKRAYGQLDVMPDYLLTDFLKLTELTPPVEALVKGDARSQVIAAASIVAKVTRDRIMLTLDTEFPQYGFSKHKGYGTVAHKQALQQTGPSTIHRHTFRGADQRMEHYNTSTSLDELTGLLDAGKIDINQAENHWGKIKHLLPEMEDRQFQQTLKQSINP